MYLYLLILLIKIHLINFFLFCYLFNLYLLSFEALLEEPPLARGLLAGVGNVTEQNHHHTQVEAREEPL